MLDRRSFILACTAAATVPARADDALWALLRQGGQVVLVRHALTTPGVGDPPGMTLANCASQRNLSDEGRRDAQALGAAWRERGAVVGTLLSSPWCRCLDTARLAFQREAQVEPALSNLFGRPQNEARQVAALKLLAARRPERGNAVMVTHGSTVLALTGISLSTGEMVVLTPQPGGWRVAGRLQAGGR
jgi:phosphohistidine phosphatase SixA